MDVKQFAIIFFLALSHLFYSNAKASVNKSIEAGLTYSSILSDGSYSAMDSYDYGIGFNLGFNFHTGPNSTINFQFSYNNFIYTPYLQATDPFKNFSNKKNSQFYNFSIGFRVHLKHESVSPYLLIRPDITLMNWGELYDPEEIREIDPSAPQWNESSMTFLALGFGVNIYVSEIFDIVFDGSFAFSNKSIHLVPLNLSLKYKL